MITVKVLLGKDTVSIYRKTGDISSVESTAESGGYVITRHFETEAEYKAYAMAVEDLDGHEDWQMLTPAVTPEAPFRKGEFVRLTDDAIKRIRESFGDGPADYRKEMILEVIAWCRYEGTWIIEIIVDYENNPATRVEKMTPLEFTANINDECFDDRNNWVRAIELPKQE